MVNVGQLAELGYEVGVATSGYSDGGEFRPAVYRVAGYGAEVYVREDDVETIASLLDPEAHATRVESYENPPEPIVIEAGPSTAELVAEALQALPDGPLRKEDLASVIAALGGTSS